ncbi:outer membrane protein [Helicobacter mehlei]|uniref:Outer membrane protein n=1 Tax=Helicobacter mehlei TaxID=2316080 RepID=A0A553V1B7_9HELI|nr:outer membrane protein [Helicobacter mehlei]TSA86278.1 outer membrane protein [Helicobacter mehlei]
MRKTFYALVSSAVALSGSLTTLSAERSAWYVGASYQVGQAGQTITNKSGNPLLQIHTLPTGTYHYLAVMQGLGVSVGYKQFLGKKKWFGLRYYGFFDYGHAVFGANALTCPSGTTMSSVNTPTAGGASPCPAVANLSDMFTYGVGIDTLYNVINKQDVTFGFFFGAAIAGNSWGNTTKHFMVERGLGGKIDPAIFQFLFNAGLRTAIGKHQEFDFGVKIPTINDYYFYSKEGLAFTYRRQYSLYAGYRYNF